MPMDSHTPDIIEYVESTADPGREQLEKDRIDMTRRILFKLDARCVCTRLLSYQPNQRRSRRELMRLEFFPFWPFYSYVQCWTEQMSATPKS